MSSVKLELRLMGATDDLEAVMACAPTALWQMFRQGEVYPPSHRPQPRNVLLLPLAEWDRGYVQGTEEERAAILADEREQLRQASTVLAELASSLAGMELLRLRPEILLETIRNEDDGGFGLPADFVAAAAALHATFEIFIGVVL